MEPMYRGIPFSPQTTLTDSIGASDTVIPVADASVFPDPPNYATIGIDADGETISYAAKAGNALSGCTRAVEGTPRSWVSGSVIARNFTAKDLESLQKNLHEVGREAQSSWSQNDPSKTDYIRDKTHWKENGPVDSVLLDELVKFSGKIPSLKLLPALAHGIEVGETYFIVWDSVEYECVAKLNELGEVIVGNQYIVDKINQTGEPFCLLSQDGIRFFAHRSSREEKTIPIKIQTRNGVVYHPLPHEYIPGGVPYVQTAAVGQTIVVSEVDAEGKPTKWEAVTLEAGSLTVETITVGSDSGEEPENVAVTGLSLDLTAYSAKVGGGFYINPVVSPSNATNKAVAWKSNATNIATVDGNGYVECLAEGNAVITCTTVDGGFTASCAVSVAAAESGGDSGGDDSGDDSGGTAGETIQLSTLARTSGLMAATGTVSGLVNTYHVEIPYTEGMFVSTGSNVAWVDVDANNVPIVVLDNGAYSVPELTWGEGSKSVGGKYATQCTATLSGYSDSAIVYVSFLAGGTEGSTLETNMDEAGFYYYIPGGET